MPGLSQEVRKLIVACEQIQAKLAYGEVLSDEEKNVIEFTVNDLLAKLRPSRFPSTS